MGEWVFFLFALIAVASAVMVISARNPVVAVLFLILAFFNIAGIFLLLGAEFLAMILVIVYVGAVAVLFLFVVMMLNIDFAVLRESFLSYFPLAFFAGGILLAELSVAFLQWPVTPAIPVFEDNTMRIGMVLYTEYFYPFQIVGLILLSAMIGAILLVLRDERKSRRQDAAFQSNVDPKERIELVDVPSGEGVPE